LMDLGLFLEELEGVDKVEVLPYHRMGVYKWRQLGLRYPLDDVMEPGARDIERARQLIEQGRKLAKAAAVR